MKEKHVQPFVQLLFFVILHRLITKFINYDMKKSKILMAFIAVVLFMAPQESSAQSLLQKLGGAVSSLTSSGSSSSSTSGNLVQTVANLLGTIALHSDSLQGTWVYSQPCVAFESENVLTSLGGVAASAKVESTLKSLLQKAGFTEGKVTLTFNADSTGVITCGSRNVDVQDIGRAAELVQDKDTPLFVYCYSGARSSRAVSALRSMGYTNVTNIGGIAGYRGQIEG